MLNHGEVSLRVLEETYQRRTGLTADHSSFGKRLGTISPQYFRAIFEFLYDQLSPTIKPGEAKALRIRRIDATTVILSAKLIGFGHLYTNTGQTRTGQGHRSIKSVFSLTEEGLPSFLRLAIAREENSDVKALGRALREHARPNDLWVFDAGCHDRNVMLALHQAKAYFLTPHSTQTLNIDQVVQQTPPEELLSSDPGKQSAHFQVVRVETAAFGNHADKKKWQQMPLVVVQGLRWDLRTKQWKPMTLMTNLPLSADGTRAGLFTFEEVGDIYRRRWEIESFFKFIKQHLGFEHIISRTLTGIEVMIYMSLIAALLMIWYQRVTRIDRGWKAVKIWLSGDAQEWAQDLLFDAMDIRLRKPKRYRRAV
jgi:hypothetical protein